MEQHGNHGMRNPPHPGEMLRDDVFRPLGLNVSDAAERLGVPCSMLSRVLDSQADISPDLAMRLERAGFGTARFWIALQSNHDQHQ